MYTIQFVGKPWMSCPVSDSVEELIRSARAAKLEGWVGTFRVVNRATGEIIETISKR